MTGITHEATYIGYINVPARSVRPLLILRSVSSINRFKLDPSAHAASSPEKEGQKKTEASLRTVSVISWGSQGRPRQRCRKFDQLGLASSLESKIRNPKLCSLAGSLWLAALLAACAENCAG